MVDEQILCNLIQLAGLAQIVLVLGSLAIPKMLHWREELSKTNVLIKQMFWTYAGYILVINLSFGIISIIGVKELLNGSFLAKVINLFIAVYWISRILIQFFYFDTSAAPKGFIYKLGEIILVAVFLFLAIAYSLAFLFNITEWEFSI